MAELFSFCHLQFALAPGWNDVTDRDPNRYPQKLAKLEGVGELSFVFSTEVDGVPHRAWARSREARAAQRTNTARLGVRDLLDHLDSFGRLGAIERNAAPTEVREVGGRNVAARGDFFSDAEIVRVWYVSNGGDLVSMIYRARPPLTDAIRAELRDVEGMVTSIEPWTSKPWSPERDG